MSIPDSLRKDAVVIPQSIAVARQLESSHGVNKTGSKSSQTTITKTSIFFLLLQIFKVQTKLREVCEKEGREGGREGKGWRGREREREEVRGTKGRSQAAGIKIEIFTPTTALIFLLGGSG